MKPSNRKPLRCGKCQHLVGTVRVRPVFRRKLILQCLGIALAMQILAEGFVEIVKRIL